mmetsp:Transcript_105912/g.299407  ORF Transcript_105912/g.299407 Transcript_105912/m.299407 type:complete len:220 (+) Transcript_105912:58-717(+)
MSRSSRAILLLLVSALAVVYFVLRGRGGSGSDTTIDGLAFPSTIQQAGVTQQFIGGGTRFKYSVVKVYAVGVYLEKAGVAALAQYESTPAEELLKRQGFFKGVIIGPFAKTLLLRFHRSVSGTAVVKALRDALKPRLPAGTVDEFEGILTSVVGDKVPRDSQLYLTCKGEALHVSASPGTGPSLRAKGLCAALFGVYLGESPVAPAARDGLAAGFAALG